MKWFRIGLALIMLFSLQCTGRSQKESSGITEIRMQRSGCPPAACPTDDVTLRADGFSDYLGIIAVPQLGIRKGYIQAYEFKSLADFLIAQDFFSLKDTPPRGVGQGDGVTITVVRDGNVHRLRIRDPYYPSSAMWGIMMAIRGLVADMEWSEYDSGVRGAIEKMPVLRKHEKVSIWVQQTEEPFYSFRVPVSESGKFEIRLPPGDYFLRLQHRPPVGKSWLGERIQWTVPEFGFVKGKLKFKAPKE